MATLEIGTRTIEVPVLNFRRLKKAWPLLQKVANTSKDSPLASFDDAAAAILIALEDAEGKSPFTIEAMEEELTAPQVMLMLQHTLPNVMRESGLVTERKSAEGKAQEDESSTEILMPSSQNSSQGDAAEEAGE